MTPLWILVGLFTAAFAVRQVFANGWPFPQCLLRKFTGIPCPACGSTRSLEAWARGDVEQALCYNPLFFLACLAVVLWLAVRVTETLIRRPMTASIWAAATSLPLWRLAMVLIALNWLYLCIKLPK